MSTSKVHVSLDVADVERSVKFYQAFFGEPAHKRRAGYANFDLSTPPLKLALNESTSTGRGSLNHMGVVLDTREQVQAARERLEQSGLVQFDEGDTVCCYARQDKVWVQDPDGNRWEVYVILDDMLDEEHQVEPCCDNSTCDCQSVSAAKCCG